MLRYKWVVFNSTVAAIMISAYLYGILDNFLIDKIHLSQGIIALGIIVICKSGLTTLQLKKLENRIPKSRNRYKMALDIGRGEDYKEMFISRINSMIVFFRTAEPLLVGLGITGTIIGVIMAFQGMSPDIVGNIDKSREVIVIMKSGLSTSFNTTLWGSVFMLWNIVNRSMLSREASKIYNQIFQPFEN